MEDIEVSANDTQPHTKASVKRDAINSEFLYYSSVLRVLAPALTGDVDRQLIIPWVRKLFRPEYHGSMFREKRNRYLLYLILTLMNDEAYGIFKTIPPSGALPGLESMQHKQVAPAEWETDQMWRETLVGLPPDFQSLACGVHLSHQECDADHQLDTILDEEFQFFLYLARPYAATLSSPEDKTRIATWLQLLCTIHSRACSSMRAIRNDYMMAMLGYIHDLRVAGPFKDYPPWNTLLPLAEAAKLSAEAKPLTDPGCPEANEFLSSQPIPDDGAFCYIAITGDLVSANFGPAE